MKCLFLGYDKNKTRLIQLLTENGCEVTHKISDLQIDDIKRNNLIISFGYRKIINKKILSLVERPIINLHLSFLPFNRGAHPNFWSFIDNTPSGVTIHEIDEGIDTGPIIYQKKFDIDILKDNFLTFRKTYSFLFREVEELFEKNLKNILEKKYTSISQKKGGSFHKEKELPHFIENWDLNILEAKKRFNKQLNTKI